MLLTCGLDGSAASLTAACFAANLSSRAGARLHLVHVTPASRHADARQCDASDLAVWEQLGLHSALAEALASIAGVRVALHVGEGDAARVLLRHARQTRCDLLVVGHRARRGLPAALRPGTSARLAAEAGCPVALVPERAPADAPGHVVAGSHGTPAGRRAAAAAARLSAALGTDLAVVRAAPPPHGRRPTGWQRYDDARRRKRPATAQATRVDVVEHEDGPVAALADAAARSSALLVVGQPARRLPVRAFGRTVASRLAVQAQRAVVVVPAARARARRPPARAQWGDDRIARVGPGAYRARA